MTTLPLLIIVALVATGVLSPPIATVKSQPNPVSPHATGVKA